MGLTLVFVPLLLSPPFAVHWMASSPLKFPLNDPMYSLSRCSRPPASRRNCSRPSSYY
ncbi:hypothetical protein PITC_037150 [Penicillium italicum]|uniref:Uncharacterized protein n=1 Tax=Penicillium italicum TaxID=40296 RepID=A0A0A2L8K8_PENIT|nr:hypothetical protein PITC_037150 [Penicillium italicum]